VLTAVAIIPSTPLLVPELAGAATVELTDLSGAVRAAATVLPSHWIAVGVDTVQRTLGPELTGTFAGYGADVRVALSPSADQSADLPLCALITAWVRGQVSPQAVAETVCLPASLDSTGAVERGGALRAELDARADSIGVLVVADGCHTLTPPAPGGYDPGSVVVQTALDDASHAHYGAPLGFIGQGGTIPLMNMLQEGFPAAQMMVCGVLGPKSNAHGPNEFLHVPYGKKLTAAVAQVIAAHP